MNAKRRSLQQIIAEEAVTLFRKSLKNDKNLYFIFSETAQQYDSGIDGSMQVFNLKSHTGEYYQVQIKGCRKVKLLKSGLISFSLDFKSAEFLIEEIKEPTILIVADNTNEKVYWHDIQTNLKTIDLYRKAKKINKKTFTLYIDPLKTIPNSVLEMYEYLKNANFNIARKEVLRKLKASTLAKSLNDLEEYNREALNIDGYYWKYGIDDLNNAVMTIIDQGRNPITYYPKGKLKEENIIKIKFNAKFTDSKDYEKLNKVLTGQEDFLQIPKEHIDDFIVSTESKKILDSTTDGKVEVRISPVLRYSKIILYFTNIEEEIVFDIQSWLSKDGSLIVESANFSNEPIRVLIKIIGLKIVDFKIYINKKYIKNFKDLYKNLSFISRIKGNITGYLVQGSKRIKIGTWKIKRTKEKEKNFDKILKLLNKLLIIEEKKNVTFDFSPTLDLTGEDIFNIVILHNLLEKGECIIRLNVKFGTKLEIKENGFLSTEIENPHFKVLDKDITFNDKKLYISGKIDKINEVSKDSNGVLNYKLLITNAIMSFTKKLKLENE